MYVFATDQVMLVKENDTHGPLVYLSYKTTTVQYASQSIEQPTFYAEDYMVN